MPAPVRQTRTNVTNAAGSPAAGTPTNLQRIIDDLRGVQQGTLTAPDRTQSTAPRTPSPFSNPNGVADLQGREDAASQARLQEWQSAQQGVAEQDKKFKAQAAIDDEERARSRGRSSTMVTGGLGVTSRANTGRATLMGN